MLPFFPLKIISSSKKIVPLKDPDLTQPMDLWIIKNLHGRFSVAGPVGHHLCSGLRWSSSFSGFLRKQLISRMFLKIPTAFVERVQPHTQVWRPWSQTNRKFDLSGQSFSGSLCTCYLNEFLFRISSSSSLVQLLIEYQLSAFGSNIVGSSDEDHFYGLKNQTPLIFWLVFK